jgi:phosphomannomutase
MINRFSEVYIFDIDGTLTPPRQAINKEFGVFFEEFANNHNVYLATGSDRKKVLEQLPKKVLHACIGCFSCMGNELYVNDQLIYSRRLNINPKVIKWLEDAVKKTKYPKEKLFEKNFEFRAGMLNFSILGRNANKNSREDYFRWDQKTKERLDLANQFNKNFKNYGLEAVIGGEISIDIQSIGHDKGQIYDYLANYDKKIFFGDKCNHGENDYSLYQKSEIKFHVKNWQQTFSVLKEMF